MTEQIQHTDADYDALAEECERYRQWWFEAAERAVDAKQRAGAADRARYRAEIRAAAWWIVAKKLARQHRNAIATARRTSGGDA